MTDDLAELHRLNVRGRGPDTVTAVFCMGCPAEIDLDTYTTDPNVVLTELPDLQAWHQAEIDPAYVAPPPEGYTLDVTRGDAADA